MEHTPTCDPVELREPPYGSAPAPSLGRLLRIVLIERRVPQRLQRALERTLHALGSRTKIVEVRGLRFRVRRLGWDEGFINHAIEREDYTKKGFALGEADVVIDIGANIGAFSVYAASRTPRGRVLAFEPASDNYALLVQNAELNRLHNLTHVRAAVAGRSGTVTLYRGDASGVHSTTEGRLAKHAGTEEVEALSLEEVFRRYGVEHCDLLKLNCEGAEFEILYGAPNAVLSRIRRISMEYHANENKRKKANDLVDYLCRNGFEVVEYTDYVDLDCGFLIVRRADRDA